MPPAPLVGMGRILFSSYTAQTLNCIYVQSSDSSCFNSSDSSEDFTSTCSDTDNSFSSDNPDDTVSDDELVHENDIETDNLKVYYMNADCLLNKISELQVHITLYSPDIIVVSEVFTKGRNARLVNCNEYKLQGYVCYTGNVTENCRGVFIYVKEGIPADACEIMNNMEFQESTWCELRLNRRDKVLIGGIYKSPNTSIENHFKLFELMQCEYVKSHKNVVIVGDFNFPGIDWNDWSTIHSENHVTYKFIELLRDNFMHQHVTENTRYRVGQNPSLLDLIITNDEDIVENITYRDTLGASDHIGLTFEIACKLNINVNRHPRTNFFKGNYEACREYLSKVDWKCIDDKNVHKTWEFIRFHVSHCIESFIPLRKSKTVNNKPKWMDHYCVRAVKRKYHAWKRFTYTRNYNDYQEYCKFRNKAAKAVHFSKKKHGKLIAENAKSSPKAFWSYVREQTKTRSGMGDLKTEQGDCVTDDKEKADLMNNFFASVFTDEDKSNIPDFEQRVNDDDCIDSVNIQSDFILKQLKALNVSKSCGPDDFHPMFLKECANELYVPITRLFQKSIAEGAIPDEWRKANVTCIFKKGSKSEPGNYRPVSLTSVICKLLERIVKRTVYEHLNKHDLLSNDQYGFRDNRSTVLQLLNVLEEWTLAIEENRQVDNVYFDFAKAFDTVPHQRLLSKVDSYGIKGNIASWIESFLYNRKQRVVINGNQSEWTDVKSGVPQGSVLGPLLFVLYINDMPQVVKSACKLFADDTKIYRVITGQQDIENLQSDIDALGRWSDNWLLRFNPNKCKTIHIGRAQYDSVYSMLDKDGVRTDIAEVDTEKDLGIHFTPNLSFDKHINTIVNKANSLVGLIKRNFVYMDCEQFLSLYKALIRPHLDYGNCIYYPITKKNKQAIENVQRRATKLVPAMKDISYENRLKALNLPTLEYRRKRGDLIIVYKLLHNLLDLDFKNFFTLATTPHDLRQHPLKIQKPRATKNIRQKSFSHRVINDWNSLSSDIVLAKNVDTFKRLLDRDVKWRLYRFELTNIY